MNLTFPGGSFFSPKPPSVPAPPPLPTPEDPAIKARAEDVRLAAKRRRGAAANILAPNEEASAPNLSRPGLTASTTSRLLGGN